MTLLTAPLVARAVTVDEEPETAVITVAADVREPVVVHAPEPPPITRQTVREMVEQEFGPNHIMVSVARAESQFDHHADNPHSTAYGVFQILVGTWAAYGCTGERGNPRDNIACARIIYDRDGLRPWYPSKHMW